MVVKKISPKQRFAEEYKMPIVKVRRLVTLAKEAGKANEHYSNGDVHPLQRFKEDENNRDKSIELWGNEVDRITHLIWDNVKDYGFTFIEYNGLGPTLKRGDIWVEIPY